MPTSSSYVFNRKKFGRPQAMLWSENPGTYEEGFYAPEGYEIGQDPEQIVDTSLSNQFLILSDHNRSAIDFKNTRLESRERMINGRMRSYHIADKMTISMSWQMLPSRGFSADPDFDSTTANSSLAKQYQYTADNGAGGAEILDWYNNHQGSFWVFLAYDNYKNFETDKYNRLNQYNEVIEMYISDFSYSVEKRGQTNHDLWNISVTLEEV